MDDIDRENTTGHHNATTGYNALMKHETDICPHCGQQIDELAQAEGGVYAMPCGCWLWDGDIPEAWAAPQENENDG